MKEYQDPILEIQPLGLDNPVALSSGEPDVGDQGTPWV